MDLQERIPDNEAWLRAALDGLQARLWTGFPGIITAVNLTALTCSVQPAIQGIKRNPDYTWSYETLPLLVDVPLVFPRGGGYTLTFPVAAGDECLVVIGNRCIDAWWQLGGVQPPMDTRAHDLSDAFALVGPFSQPQRIGGVSGSTVQLRSNDGSVYVEVDKGGGVVHLKAPTKIKLEAPLVETTGSLTVDGNAQVNLNLTVTGDITAQTGSGASIGLRTHVHPNVQTGPDDTGPPVGGT